MPYPWFHAHASPCSRHLGIPVVFAYASVPSAWGRRETFSATIQVGYSVVPQVNKAAALQGPKYVSARSKNLWGSPPRIGQGRTHWVLKEAISAEDHVVIIDDIVRTEGLKMFKHV